MDERIAPQQLKKGYDCVVIGAGNGGLGAAAQLAAKGAKVLVLEQHSVPGGFASSFVRGRFESAHRSRDRRCEGCTRQEGPPG